MSAASTDTPDGSSSPALAQLIPHRPPFCFVDEIVEMHGTGGTFALALRHDDARLQQGRIPALLLLEALAQSAAALHGAAAAGAQSEAGVLAQIDKATLARDALAGERVLLAVERTHAVGPLVRLAAEATAAGVVLARADLSVRRGVELSQGQDARSGDGPASDEMECDRRGRGCGAAERGAPPGVYRDPSQEPS